MIGVPAIDLSSFDPGPIDPVAIGMWAVGWCAGWVLLWHRRPLPQLDDRGVPDAPGDVRVRRRESCAVVVPARNEAAAIGLVVADLAAQLRPGDELVVVDDHSTDDTAAIAHAAGARVVPAPALPPGWLGKPHACWTGACSTNADALVFVDADVRPAPDLLDRIVHRLGTTDRPVVSVQPWHETGRAVEQASIVFNVVSLMGSGAFALGSDGDAEVAFGPVLAVRRETYLDIGGHAAESVRARHTEDIELARVAGGATLHSGRPDTTFRMYPDGLRATLRGWTRTIATGIRSTPWWVAIAVTAWVWSLAGGWIAEPIVYPFTAAQVWVLGRRAGSLHPATAVLYPVAVAVFVGVVVASACTLVTRRQIEWKDRRIVT
jgi:4,4'-diaponeurosporenoate glycosyltransferase